MKERIYTIPVSEAFREDCECPLCLLENNLENDALEYTLGPSMMEPDSRIETNKKGFCRKHFTKLYNLQKNRLALGLVIDTHLMEQIGIIKKLYEKNQPEIQREALAGTMEHVLQSVKGKKSVTTDYVNEMIKKLAELEETCTICEKINRNMEKFIDVILYLFFKEPDFKETFISKKGFCLHHVKQLMEGSLKYLNSARRSEFILTLMSMEIIHLERIKEEVNWFTLKFDYKNKNEPWKNSQDAIPRGIEKICGLCDLIR